MNLGFSILPSGGIKLDPPAKTSGSGTRMFIGPNGVETSESATTQDYDFESGRPALRIPSAQVNLFTAAAVAANTFTLAAGTASGKTVGFYGSGTITTVINGVTTALVGQANTWNSFAIPSTGNAVTVNGIGTVNTPVFVNNYTSRVDPQPLNTTWAATPTMLFTGTGTAVNEWTLITRFKMNIPSTLANTSIALNIRAGASQLIQYRHSSASTLPQRARLTTTAGIWSGNIDIDQGPGSDNFTCLIVSVGPTFTRMALNGIYAAEFPAWTSPTFSRTEVLAQPMFFDSSVLYPMSASLETIRALSGGLR